MLTQMQLSRDTHIGLESGRWIVDLGLGNARVIVTGGASNIGQGIVFGFATEGARIAVLDKDARQAERTAERARQLGAAEVTVITVDLAAHAAAEAACREALDRLGGVDVLAANVGWVRPNFFLEVPPETWDQLLHVNLSSCMSCVRALLPTMIEQRRGSIVATASTAAYGEPRQGVYGAAKAGLVAFIKTIALEYGRFGIRANLVAPGLVLPEGEEALGEDSLWQQRDTTMNESQVDYVLKNTPLRRLSRPDDIARAILFLASEITGRQVTGQMIAVSGGFAMR